MAVLALGASLFFAIACNGPYLTGTLAGRSWSEPAAWLFAGAMLAMLVSLHMLLLSLVLTRWTARPLLAVLIVATAFATYYMQRFGVFLDPSMLRKVLTTDPAEAVELFGWGMVPHLLLYAGLPLLVLLLVRPAKRTFRRAAISGWPCWWARLSS